MEQEKFLRTYFKDKPEFVLLDSIFDEDGNWIGQQAGDDYTNVDIIEENNCYYCKISSHELGYNLLAHFVLPETYEQFKILLDIFLNTDKQSKLKLYAFKSKQNEKTTKISFYIIDNNKVKLTGELSVKNKFIDSFSEKDIFETLNIKDKSNIEIILFK